MARPVLSRLKRVLAWAKAGSASPKVRSSRDNFFIPLLVGGERETLQQWQAAKPHRPETGGASQPPVACNGSRWPASVIQAAKARPPPAAFGRKGNTNSPCVTSPLWAREDFTKFLLLRGLMFAKNAAQFVLMMKLGSANHAHHTQIHGGGGEHPQWRREKIDPQRIPKLREYGAAKR